MADTIVFTVKGKKYPMPEKMTFGDAALLKKLGINLAELQIAAEDEDNSVLADPLVMGGLLLVAMKHAGVKVTTHSLDTLEISEVDVELPDTPDDDDEEPEADPLEVTPPTPPSSSETTPADSGLPDSSTSTDSTPGT